MQIGFFDPGETGNLSFGTNGQDFRIRGVETSIVARVTQGLTVQGAASWNSSVQTNSPQLIDTNPASVNFGKAITEKCSTTLARIARRSTTYSDRPAARAPTRRPFSSTCVRATTGQSTATTPSYSSAASTRVIPTPSRATILPSRPSGINTTLLRFENPAYSTFDASLGVAKDAWTAHLYSQNLFNKETSLFTNTAQFAVAQTALRPRVIGVKFGYKF